MGTANDYAHRQLLGLTEAELAALADEGHRSLDYLRPDGTPR